MSRRDILVKILDHARWAPSGDNTQPWRFQIASDDHIVVRGFDTREWCVYDFDGHASHIAHGALLETLRIAASGFSLEAEWALRKNSPDAAPIYDVRLSENRSATPDPLLPYIEKRVVQRRPMRMTPLESAQREALISAAGPDHRVQLFESFRERWSVARLLWRNAYIRLTCPEAYVVHREIIEWSARYSEDRIPEAAVGVDLLTAKLMRWVMEDWSRVEFFNRYLLGTVAPRVQLDLIPAIACSAHVLIRPNNSLSSLMDYVRLGEVSQRVWLTATAVDLHLQPEMTPVIFRWYVRGGRSISKCMAINSRATALAGAFEQLVGAEMTDPFGFFARVGESAEPSARSLRKPMGDLWFKPTLK